MIDFEQTPAIAQMAAMMRAMATHQMRPIAREMDENEHADPTQYFEFIWESTKGYFKENARPSGKAAASTDGSQAKSSSAPATGQARQCVIIEQMSWGDAGIYLATPNPGLGGAAVSAVATPEQKERFLKRFGEGKPKWAAMAITEPGCGSDSAAISTTAVLDGDSWVINGSKIFVTGGKRAVADSDGFVVVWATVDRTAGRAGIKSFVVEHHTPGMTVLKVEKKHGIRCSDTAAIVFENCRIPKDNILGSAEVAERGEGFKGAMATFDATRPAVAASAIGIGRAALEYVQERFEKEGLSPRYGISPQKLAARERDLMMMEANLRASWLLTLRACWMGDQKLPNNLEASMCKAKAGLAVTQVTQKAVEMMGPEGYSRKLLLEKWMRDAKINDIFEGTQQINMLIIARRILGYSKEQLK
ncbi:MAG: acyl-CoA dehydrogenase family protein [Polyangiaceae bacterium]